ncbi:alpha/beta fold hydrolase [Agromyces bracchium]|uniref:Alpha/beta fold hydrolase n=1 Tax=Agromyces bracchium TaxID=88376 RepID=A0A6I3M4Y9_9MICO|nr:alpha/beta fold hydrolase [Agromyces bracchium]
MLGAVTHPLVIVPGIGGSGPEHWQSRWEAALPGTVRIAPGSWDEPDLSDWVAAIERAVASTPARPVLVAHSLGCLAVAHWAVETDAASARIAGAFLVAPPDPAGPEFPSAAVAGGFTLPLGPLGIPATVLASSDDPYAELAWSAAAAAGWGAGFIDLGARGHVNAASGLGEWPEGLQLLEDAATTARRAAGPPAA